MIHRDELIKFINDTIGSDILTKAIQKDEMPNGVQFLGGGEVEKIALGVSLNEEFLVKAGEWGSNFCVFHHAFDVRTYKSLYSLSSQKRLKAIFENNMTVMGFHYALDAHKTLGNNAIIIKKLGAKLGEPLFEEWGYMASFEKPRDLHDLGHKCEELFDHEIFVVAGGPEKVKKIGVVSGGAKPYAENIAEMENLGIELFISGETSESVPHKMQESGINYFVCGHYATEVFGVKALGEEIKKQFGKKMDVEFINVDNPI